MLNTDEQDQSHLCYLFDSTTRKAIGAIRDANGELSELG